MRHYILDEKYWVNKNYVLRFFFLKFCNTRFKCNLENLLEENYPLESKIDFKKNERMERVFKICLAVQINTDKEKMEKF